MSLELQAKAMANGWLSWFTAMCGNGLALIMTWEGLKHGFVEGNPLAVYPWSLVIITLGYLAIIPLVYQVMKKNARWGKFMNYVLMAMPAILWLDAAHDYLLVMTHI